MKECIKMEERKWKNSVISFFQHMCCTIKFNIDYNLRMYLIIPRAITKKVKKNYSQNPIQEAK
jgi:hypothetical protein